jgi:hypothetical protein
MPSCVNQEVFEAFSELSDVCVSVCVWPCRAVGAGLFAQFGARVTTSLLLAHSGVPRNRKPFAVVGAVRGLRTRLRLRQNNQLFVEIVLSVDLDNALAACSIWCARSRKCAAHRGFCRRTWIPNPTDSPSDALVQI